MKPDATSFPDAVLVVAQAVNAGLPSAFVSNVTPSPIPAKAVIVGYAGPGTRGWGEASVNLAFNLYDTTEAECRALVIAVQNFLATLSNDSIEFLSVPAGGAIVIPGQKPFHQYFVATAHLRGLAVL